MTYVSQVVVSRYTVKITKFGVWGGKLPGLRMPKTMVELEYTLMNCVHGLDSKVACHSSTAELHALSSRFL